jgi:hypothetical protein
MTENDLAPLPPNFRERNDPAQVLLDAEALQRLGYLPDDAPACALADPTATILRLAVLAFQRASGIAEDGLLGPATRLTIARALRDAGPPVTEGFHYLGIGDLAPVVQVKLSADITDGFLLGVQAMAQRFQARGSRARAEDWLRVWFVESAGLHANRPNGGGEPYGGLNQMGPDERAKAGFKGTFAQWLALSEAEQLPFVERFYAAKPVQLINDARGVYVATFAPAFFPQATNADAVLYRYRGDKPGMPAVTASAAEWAAYNKTHSDPYGENRVFDRQRKGFITVGDLTAPIDGIAKNPRWLEIQARIRALGGGTAPSAPGSRAGVLVASVVGTLAAVGALAWWTLRA